MGAGKSGHFLDNLDSTACFAWDMVDIQVGLVEDAYPMVDMWAVEIDPGNTHAALMAPEDPKGAFYLVITNKLY